MEVLADALALVDDRQALDLLVQAGVLDGDRGVASERLDEFLVVRGELGGVALVRQVEIADRSTFHRDGYAQEARHRRVMGREAMAPRVRVDVGDPERSVLLDDQTEESVAAGQRPDLCPCLIGQATGDETLDDAVAVDDAERRVLGADQRTDLVDDDLEDLVHGQDAGDSAGRGVDGIQEIPRRCARSPTSVIRRSLIDPSLAPRPSDTGRTAPEDGTPGRCAMEGRVATIAGMDTLPITASEDRFRHVLLAADLDAIVGACRGRGDRCSPPRREPSCSS